MQAVLGNGRTWADISGMAGMQVGYAPSLTVLQYNQGDIEKESRLHLIGA
jgi:hypothetical protein